MTGADGDVIAAQTEPARHRDQTAAFRLGVTLFALAVATLFILVFGIQARLAGFTGSKATYDPHVILFLSWALLLCAVQGVIAWRAKGLGQLWWRPPFVEVLLAYGIAITSSQALAGSNTSCTDGRCVKTYATYFPWWWLALCISVGLIIGGEWSYLARANRQHAAAVQGAPAHTAQ